MIKNKNIIKLELSQWQALSNIAISTADWKNWCNNGNYKTEQPLPTQLIPPLVRRRMSTLSKLAVQVALQILTDNRCDYIIFSSRHGELHRTVDIIKSIVDGEDASPMAFSQSVHNTASGLTTIIAKSAVPVTSISAGEESFHQAILEAYGYLSENPEHTVLLVDFDQPLPDEYQQYSQSSHCDYALGLLIKTGHTHSLSWNHPDQAPPEHVGTTKSSLSATNPDNCQLPHALQFIRYQYSEDKQLTVACMGKQWQWVRSDE